MQPNKVDGAINISLILVLEGVADRYFANDLMPLFADQPLLVVIKNSQGYRLRAMSGGVDNEIKVFWVVWVDIVEAAKPISFFLHALVNLSTD